jgi:hypothetical protein
MAKPLNTFQKGMAKPLNTFQKGMAKPLNTFQKGMAKPLLLKVRSNLWYVFFKGFGLTFFKGI